MRTTHIDCCFKVELRVETLGDFGKVEFVLESSPGIREEFHFQTKRSREAFGSLGSKFRDLAISSPFWRKSPCPHISNINLHLAPFSSCFPLQTQYIQYASTQNLPCPKQQPTRTCWIIWQDIVFSSHSCTCLQSTPLQSFAVGCIA